MRLPQLFLAVCLFGLAAPFAHGAVKSAPHHKADPFAAELNRQCPGRNLQDLTAGDLSYIQEGFVAGLPLAQRHSVEDAVGRRCARIEAGLSCANAASLDAFRRLGVLPRFTATACATRWTCKAPGECVEDRP